MGGGWSHDKESKSTGTKTHKSTTAGLPTHTPHHTHSSITVPSFTSDPVSWLVLISQFFFFKRHHIGGPLLCSTSAQRWHHSVWEVTAIFRLRRRALAAASPASLHELAQKALVSVVKDLQFFKRVKENICHAEVHRRALYSEYNQHLTQSCFVSNKFRL